ncbi:isoleucine--tRNA ligase [Pikeienuella piscinae]|uniref:Isoleucine--tRNA ligase n=1 Tax=Pikeienuella piscinae TaxID=2748098 RepID=A0A7L5BVJ7_9RHOB|nr:isoleucine--tRNA ligase [Pikeienuella piscinae]QIE55875.1 isoleucine--tRNA ligase [Pikeienuella piscinae]
MCAQETAPDAQDKTDYKATLRLPQTDFPMRAGLPAREPDWLAKWEAMDIYGRLRAKTGRPPFTLHDGPPYANGHLHIGHALNKTIKDMIVRSRQMMGHDSRYVPGWDCHGLPIEWKIEEQYRAKGLDKDDVPINELRAECRKFAAEWVDIQRKEFKRLGVTGNWDDPYLTMDFRAEAVIAEEFMKFVMNGSLYQGSKPVMWSVVEKTALAEAEVEYHEHKSHTIWVKFPVAEVATENFTNLLGEKDGTSFSGDIPDNYSPLPENTSVLIWTTTPWTIPQNRAICFNPSISYGLYRVTNATADAKATTGDYLLLADPLASEIFEKGKILADGWERVRDVYPGELKAITCAHPFRGAEDANSEWDFDVPLLPGDHVTDDAGTGFVHTAPSHGADDYVIGQKHGLPMTHNVLEDGSFREDIPFFGGQVIFDEKGKEAGANVAVIRKLAEVGALFAKGSMRHSYPHSWRSKAPLIFRNTPQWFAAIDKPLEDGMNAVGKTIRERALGSIDKLVAFTPASGRNRLRSMIAARPDWVLSRQRAWGVPMTCFKREVAPGEVEVLKNAEVNARIAAAFREEGADAWFKDGAKERFLSGIEGVDPTEWEMVTDILDVWFDSGSTHAFVLRDREDGTEDGIADVYMEGTDQHRGWFHSSLLQACGTIGRAPYRAVVTHGFTLDGKGQKMSKSLGNTIVPEAVVKQYGADILRLWVAQSDYTADQRISPEILKGVADSYRRLRNSLRFILGNLDGFSEVERVDPAEMPELERWVLHRVAELDRIVRGGYGDYAFSHVFQQLFQFCTVDLSTLYFDIRKDALYCDAPDSLRRRAARTVLDILFHRLTAWLAPILVFTMEEVWLERFPGEESSIHLQDFPETPDWRDPSLASRWEAIRRVRRVVTGALEVERREKRIGASLEAAPAVFVADDAARGHLHEVDFADLCITSGIRIEAGEGPADAFRLDEVPGVAVVPALASGAKCARCWKVLPEVGGAAHPDICNRCAAALA